MLKAMSFLRAGACGGWYPSRPRSPPSLLCLRLLATERGAAANATQSDPHPSEPFVEEDAQGDVNKVAADLRTGALAERSGKAEDTSLKSADHTSLENMNSDPTQVQSYYKSKAKEAGSNEMLRMQNNPDIVDAAMDDESNVSIGMKERGVTGSQQLERDPKTSKE